MTGLDYAKAVGTGAAVLVLDVLLAIAVVYLWSLFIAPGHPRAYYQTAGVPIALVSTRVLGSALIFAACWRAARHNPRRNAFGFALLVVISYALLDALSAGFQGVLTPGFGLTMLLKVGAALAGALLAVRTRRPG